MSALSTLLGGLLAVLSTLASALLGIGPALYLFFLIVFAFVMTVNYRRMRSESWHPDLANGEQERDRLGVTFGVMRTQTLLTTRRVVQLRLSWLFSKRKAKVVDLDAVHSIVWRRYTNWFLIVGALYFLGTWNPFAFLFFLFGVQGKVYSVRFATPFAQMPYTRIVVTTWWRTQYQELRRFYASAWEAWSLRKSQLGDTYRGGLAPLPVPQSEIGEQDFAWGRSLLVYVGVLMAAAFLQKMSEPHVWYEDYLFTTLYLSLPVAVAHRSLRDAGWLALLGFVALLTIKFPGGGLAALLTNDGGVPAIAQYAVVLVGLEVIVGIAALIGRGLHLPIGFLALALWPGVIAALNADMAQDIGLYSQVLVAMGVSVLLTQFDPVVQARAERA